MIALHGITQSIKRGGSIVTDGLVLHLDAGNAASYPGSGTTWTDLSGNGNNATLTNGPTFDSANGGSIALDGVNDYIDCGTSSTLRPTTEITASIWIKFISTGSDVRPYGDWNGNAVKDRWLYFFDSSGVLDWYIKTNTTQQVRYNNVQNNLWYNITGVYNGNTQYLYVNGSLIESKSLTGSMSNPNDNDNPVRIGKELLQGGFTNGNVASVLMYSRGISSLEVTQNFNALKDRYGL
jgi:hypothetical protein